MGFCPSDSRIFQEVKSPFSISLLSPWCPFTDSPVTPTRALGPFLLPQYTHCPPSTPGPPSQCSSAILSTTTFTLFSRLCEALLSSLIAQSTVVQKACLQPILFYCSERSDSSCCSKTQKHTPSLLFIRANKTHGTASTSPSPSSCEPVLDAFALQMVC